MNAINSTLDKANGTSVFLLKQVLWNMAYGEKRTRTICPVCQKRKNFDDLACDMCVSRYGDELNKVILNALCEIRPSKYPQKRSATINFKIVDEIAIKKPETPIKRRNVGSIGETICQNVSENVSGGDNLLEIVPEFFLYRDEIKIMADEELRFKANCPICKGIKDRIQWMCSSCAEDKTIYTSKKHLIQYAIISFSPRVDFLDGNLCGRRVEEVLLRVAVKILNSSARDYFFENIPYLVTLLRYLPGLEEKKKPLASCIISKVVYHAFAVVNGRLRFQGVVVDSLNKDVAQPTAVAIRTALQDPVNQVIGNVELVTPVLKVYSRESFSREASEILGGITENLNEDSRAGKSLSAFLSQKVLEWKEATGKKNPDTKDFFTNVPFSEKFLEQLKQNGNCSLKFFTEIAKYFAMSGEEMLSEGLCVLSALEKEKSSDNFISKDKHERDMSEENGALIEAIEEKIDLGESPRDIGEDVFVILAKSILEKIKSNLRDSPLVARALWAFIDATARKKEMKTRIFGETVGIYASSLSALRIGGNKQQCLSVYKFDEIVARLGFSKVLIVTEGLKILDQGGDIETQEKIKEISEGILSEHGVAEMRN